VVPTIDVNGGTIYRNSEVGGRKFLSYSPIVERIKGKKRAEEYCGLGNVCLAFTV
jgi:hypothetical protein